MRRAAALQTERTRQSMRGFSLVELMIALLLGAVVTLGITTMFTSNQETYRLVQGQSRMQENARFALDFITRPLRMAGYTGCVSSELAVQYAVNGTSAATPPEERGASVDYIARMGTSLEGHEAVNDTEWAPPFTEPGLNLPADFQAFIDDGRLAGGSDILTVRKVGVETLQLRNAMTSPGATVIETVEPANAAAWNAVNYALISDCDKASVFRVTAAGGGANYQLGRATGAGAGDNAASVTTDGTTFDRDAAVYEVQTSMFFVAARPDAAANRLNNRGQVVLSLWYKEGNRAPVELVEGIEDLEVLYGLDTPVAAEYDLVPNRYRTINDIDPADLQFIVTARVTIVANSVDVVTDQTATGRLSRTFSRTVALRNRVAE